MGKVHLLGKGTLFNRNLQTKTCNYFIYVKTISGEKKKFDSMINLIETWRKPRTYLMTVLDKLKRYVVDGSMCVILAVCN